MPPPYDAGTTGLDLVHDFAAQVKGKTFLLTGPSPGSIGAASVLALARGAPATLILVARSIAKISPIVSAITAADPAITVKPVQADLASLASVRAAARQILDDESIPEIDAIINNAGVMACPHQVTEDGNEMQLAVNHLGHFLLTNLLIPKLSRARGRVVIVSSSMHRYHQFNFRDPNFTASPDAYRPWDAYGSAKTADVLFATALNARGVRAIALHPGSVSTGLQDHMKAAAGGRPEAAAEVADELSWRVMGMGIAAFRARFPTMTAEQGCATSLRAALDPSLAEGDADVLWMEDCQPQRDRRWVKEWATDPELAERCWRISEQLVGQQFKWPSD